MRNPYNFRYSTIELSGVVPAYTDWVDTMKKNEKEIAETASSYNGEHQARTPPGLADGLWFILQDVDNLCLGDVLQLHILQSLFQVVLENPCRFRQVLGIAKNHV